MRWKYTKDITEGNDLYTFDGTFYVTKGVQSLLTQEEIFELYNRVKMLVILNDGIDYLQPFERFDGVKVWFIDQLTKEQKKLHPAENNHFTMLFPSEY